MRAKLLRLFRAAFISCIPTREKTPSHIYVTNGRKPGNFQHSRRVLWLSLLFISFAGLSHAQQYDQMSPEIQAVMDQNKRNGEFIWAGTQITYDVVVTGLESIEYDILKTRAAGIKEILSVSILEGGKVTLVCEGGTPFDPVKPVFSEIVSGITSIHYTVTLKTAERK